MKNILVVVVVLTLISFTMPLKKISTESLWLSHPIQVDGKLLEWPTDMQFYNSNTELAYTIANDSSNLYLCFQVFDELMQMKILKAGMVVSVDTNGKKKEHIIIQYPLSYLGGGEGREPDFADIREKFKMQPQFVQLSGFSSANGQNLLQTSNGVVVKLDWDENNNMNYELAIPFSSFGKTKLTKNSVSNTYRLKVRLPAMEQFAVDATSGATSKGGGKSGGGGKPGGGGRPAGVGAPPGVSGGDRSQFAKLFMEQKMSQKFVFSLQ